MKPANHLPTPEAPDDELKSGVHEVVPENLRNSQTNIDVGQNSTPENLREITKRNLEGWREQLFEFLRNRRSGRKDWE